MLSPPAQPAEGAARQLKALQELRDNIEIAQAQDFYERFLRNVIVGLFMTHLQTTQAHFTEGNEHKIRNTMCEIISRLAITEQLRPHARNIMKTIMHLLNVENEDNAVVCLRIVSEFHRNYRQVLEMEVQPFLDFVANLYKNLPIVVNRIFSGPASTPGDHSATDGSLLTWPCQVVLLNEFIQLFLDLSLGSQLNCSQPTIPSKLSQTALLSSFSCSSFIQPINNETALDSLP